MPFHIDGQGFTPGSLVQWQIDMLTGPTTWRPMTHGTVQASVAGNPSMPCFAKTCVIVPPGQFHVSVPDPCDPSWRWGVLLGVSAFYPGSTEPAAMMLWLC
jgi:hypothetical protein